MAFGKFGTYKRVEILIEAVEMIRKRTREDIEEGDREPGPWCLGVLCLGRLHFWA